MRSLLQNEQKTQQSFAFNAASLLAVHWLCIISNRNASNNDTNMVTVVIVVSKK